MQENIYIARKNCNISPKNCAYLSNMPKKKISLSRAY